MKSGGFSSYFPAALHLNWTSILNFTWNCFCPPCVPGCCHLDQWLDRPWKPRTLIFLPFWIFKLALLRHNLHIMKCTYIKRVRVRWEQKSSKMKEFSKLQKLKLWEGRVEKWFKSVNGKQWEQLTHFRVRRNVEDGREITFAPEGAGEWGHQGTVACHWKKDYQQWHRFPLLIEQSCVPIHTEFVAFTFHF